MNRVSPVLYLYLTVFQRSVFCYFTVLLFAHFSSHVMSLSRPPFITVRICCHNTDSVPINKQWNHTYNFS